MLFLNLNFRIIENLERLRTFLTKTFEKMANWHDSNNEIEREIIEDVKKLLLCVPNEERYLKFLGLGCKQLKKTERFNIVQREKDEDEDEAVEFVMKE